MCLLSKREAGINDVGRNHLIRDQRMKRNEASRGFFKGKKDILSVL